MSRRAVECAVCEDHAESTFRVEGLCCQHEADLLTRRLGTLRGVERTSTDVVRQQLRVAYDAAVTSTGAIAEAVAETGLRAWPDDQSRPGAPAPAAAAPAARGFAVSSLLVSSVALAVGLGLAAADAPRPATIALLALAVVFGGATTLRRAIASARKGRLDMFVLMTVAVIGAAAIGEWIEAATVVVLFALAQALERRSLDRARDAIRTLVADAPSDVVVRRGARAARCRSRRCGSATSWWWRRRAHRARRRRRQRRHRRRPGADHRRVGPGDEARRRPGLRRHDQSGGGDYASASPRRPTNRRWRASSTWSSRPRRARRRRRPGSIAVAQRYAAAVMG